MSSSCPVQTASLTRLVSVALSLVVVLFLCIAPQVRCGSSEEPEALLSNEEPAQPSQIKFPKRFTLKLIRSVTEGQEDNQDIKAHMITLADSYGKSYGFPVSNDVADLNISGMHGIDHGDIVFRATHRVFPSTFAFYPTDIKQEEDHYILTYSVEGYDLVPTEGSCMLI